jgi:hypothetical protein
MFPNNTLMDILRSISHNPLEVSVPILLLCTDLNFHHTHIVIVVIYPMRCIPTHNRPLMLPISMHLRTLLNILNNLRDLRATQCDGDNLPKMNPFDQYSNSKNHLPLGQWSSTHNGLCENYELEYVYERGRKIIIFEPVDWLQVEDHSIQSISCSQGTPWKSSGIKILISRGNKLQKNCPFALNEKQFSTTSQSHSHLTPENNVIQ